MTDKNFSSNIKFFDDNNFPYGFSRSGDFTATEAQLLTDCGHIMMQLAQKQRLPENSDQEQFLQVIEGKAVPQTPIERIYEKYIKLVERKNNVVSFIKKAPSDSLLDEDIEFDDDIEPDEEEL